MADTAVTLYVHAGIAAADVICAVSLGMYAQGDSHQDAVKLLASADAAACKIARHPAAHEDTGGIWL